VLCAVCHWCLERPAAALGTWCKAAYLGVQLAQGLIRLPLRLAHRVSIVHTRLHALDLWSKKACREMRMKFEHCTRQSCQNERARLADARTVRRVRTEWHAI
jgi:hypothetical protein